jgi:hypothetical protein
MPSCGQPQLLRLILLITYRYLLAAQVFKRISNLAVRAVQHFQQLEAAQALLQPAAAAGGGPAHSSSSSRLSAGVALECLLLWLACYDDLFSRPCDVSGKVVAWEPATAIPLPPVLRPYWCGKS